MNEKKEGLAEIMVDFATALESACVNLKRYATDFVNAEEKPLWDPDKIKWTEAEGQNGKYERSEDVNSGDFKNLLKDLAAHGGRLNRLGYFYWSFSKSAVVGRKKKE